MGIKQSVNGPNLASVIYRFINSTLSPNTYSFTIIQIIINVCHNSASAINRNFSALQMLVILSIPNCQTFLQPHLPPLYIVHCTLFIEKLFHHPLLHLLVLFDKPPRGVDNLVGRSEYGGYAALGGKRGWVRNVSARYGAPVD